MRSRGCALSLAAPIALVTAAALSGAAPSAAAAPVRGAAVVALLIGLVVLRRRNDATAWLWAGVTPLAVRLAYEALVAAPSPSLVDCGNPLAPAAVARALEAFVVVGSIAALALFLPAGPGSLALRWPAGPVVALSVVGLMIVAPLAVLVGPLLTGPFFGEVRVETGLVTAVVPALILAGSNSFMEELEFRGVLLGWGSRAIGSRTAVVLQAALFAIAHVGPDFVNPLAALPVLAAVFAGGLIAGWIVLRTRSLLLPVAIHMALDMPLYYAFGCRFT